MTVEPEITDPQPPADMEELRDHMMDFTSLHLMDRRVLEPAVHPLAAAVDALLWSAQAIAEAVSPDCARQALLMAFERMHPKPMNFIETGQAKAALTAFAEARRKAEGRPAGIIIPNGGGR